MGDEIESKKCDFIEFFKLFEALLFTNGAIRKTTAALFFTTAALFFTTEAVGRSARGLFS